MSFFEFPHTRTYDSDLGWLIAEMKKIMDESSASSEWKAQVDAKLTELENYINDLNSGDFSNGFEEGLASWISTSLPVLLSQFVKFIQFGITNTGYFCAYIPDHWDFISFDTISDGESPLFGHLILMYD